MNEILFTGVFGVVLLFSGLFIRSKNAIRYIAILGMGLAFLVNGWEYFHPGTDWPGGMIHADHVSILFNAIALGCT
ncbi:MAG TPA: hypothetical protein VMV20_02385, partial [Chitinophagaceae bacterium]|nr:hypothetical protein [Chitinophagaceae bacterium]